MWQRRRAAVVPSHVARRTQQSDDGSYRRLLARSPTFFGFFLADAWRFDDGERLMNAGSAVLHALHTRLCSFSTKDLCIAPLSSLWCSVAVKEVVREPA